MEDKNETIYMPYSFYSEDGYEKVIEELHRMGYSVAKVYPEQMGLIKGFPTENAGELGEPKSHTVVEGQEEYVLFDVIGFKREMEEKAEAALGSTYTTVMTYKDLLKYIDKYVLENPPQEPMPKSTAHPTKEEEKAISKTEKEQKIDKGMDTCFHGDGCAEKMEWDPVQCPCEDWVCKTCDYKDSKSPPPLPDTEASSFIGMAKEADEEKEE